MFTFRNDNEMILLIANSHLVFAGLGTWTKSLNRHNKFIKHTQLPHYGWQKRHTERLSDLTQVTQQVKKQSQDSNLGRHITLAALKHILLIRQ